MSDLLFALLFMLIVISPAPGHGRIGGLLFAQGHAIGLPVMLTLVLVISLVESILLLVLPHRWKKLRDKREAAIARAEDHWFLGRAQRSRVLRPFAWVLAALPGGYLPAVGLAHLLKRHPWRSALILGMLNWVGFALATRIPLPTVPIPGWVWLAILAIPLSKYLRKRIHTARLTSAPVPAAD